MVHFRRPQHAHLVIAQFVTLLYHILTQRASVAPALHIALSASEKARDSEHKGTTHRVLRGSQPCSLVGSLLPWHLLRGQACWDLLTELSGVAYGLVSRFELCWRRRLGREGQVVALNALLAAAWWYLKHGVAFLSLLDGGAMLKPGPARWLCRDFLFGTPLFTPEP